MPVEEGYYVTADNAPQAAKRYDEWKAWTAQHGLVWEGVGLDIEPDARFYQQIMDKPWGLLPLLLPRLRDRERRGGPRRRTRRWSPASMLMGTASRTTSSRSWRTSVGPGPGCCSA